MSDENVNISFIPKKPLAQAGGFRKSPVFGISFLISVTISFALIGYATFLYFQIERLEVEKQDSIDELVAYEEELQEDNIIQKLDSLRDTANQIDQAKRLLRNHVALTDLFDYIGSLAPSTLVEDGQVRSFVDPVVFNSFSFSNSEDGIVLSMNGSAYSYGTLAALSRLYNEKKESSDVLQDFTLTGFAPLADGRYSMNLTVNLDPRLISYQCVYGDENMKRSAGCVGNTMFDDAEVEASTLDISSTDELEEESS